MKNDFPGGTPVQVAAGPADVLSAGSPPALRLTKSFYPQETTLFRQQHSPPWRGKSGEPISYIGVSRRVLVVSSFIWGKELVK
ncbi:MAG: hypothetical protein Q7J85_13405 [Bacillota bacterium]|nr:hypothetical protein [Bacillota bacterium]